MKISRTVSIVFAIIYCAALQAAEIPISPGAVVPLFTNGSKQPNGTGFVCMFPDTIITCAHVVDSMNSIFCLTASGGKMVPAVPIFMFPKHDIAVLKVASNICERAFPFGDINKVRPGDGVYYIGADIAQHKLVPHMSQVSAVGFAMMGDITVQFIEFAGEGRPGYSGGPVFNEKGEVLAIMREAWTKKGVKGGPEILMNRAFSVDLIRNISSDMRPVTMGKTAAPPSSTSEAMSAINSVNQR